MLNINKTILIILLVLVTSSCKKKDSIDHKARTFYVKTNSPTVNVPYNCRQQNYGTGSCVHASNIVLLRWQGRHDIANWWRKNYSGAEGSERLTQRLNASGIDFAQTTNGDVRLLEWAINTRRGAAVEYPGGHVVNLIHLDRNWAGLLDNNSIKKIKWVPRKQFISNWKHYGGWGFTLVGNPPPPSPFYVR